MKILRLLILLGMFICGQSGRAQVFGHSGAKWVYVTLPTDAVCLGNFEISEYVGDTVVLGNPCKHIRITKKGGTLSPGVFTTSYSHRYFDVSGDSVSIFNPYDSTWQLMYDFSVQVGDTVNSPLKNYYLFSYPYYGINSPPYNLPAVVTDIGLDTISGQILGYYTVMYQTSLDTSYSYATFYERFISYDYWHPYDSYYCGGPNECMPTSLRCYLDDDMMIDSSCNDFNWYITLGMNENQESAKSNIYPNPVSNHLFIDEPNMINGKYMILSLDGRQISGWMQSPINVIHLEPGVYFVLNEARTWTKKFIKY